MPITSVKRAGVFSITSSVSTPNFSTIRFASDGPIPENTFEPRKRSIPCAVFGVTSPDVATCETTLHVVDDPSFAAAVDGGKAPYDPDKAEQCVNETANADCDATTKEGREVPAVCADVVGGTGGMGAACASSSECASH